MMKKLFGSLCIMTILAASVFASGELTGSDFVRLGTLGTVSGTLKEIDGEWVLKSDTNEYDIHFGNYEVIYPEGLKIEEGNFATVYGYIYEQDISVCTITTETLSYTFRDDLGKPAWSGRGKNKNQRTDDRGHDPDHDLDHERG